MNLGRSWALVRKELKEYRRQRFILSTLLIPPVVLAIVGPIGSSLPLYLEGHAVPQSSIDAFPRPSIELWLGPQNSSAYLASHTANGELRLDHVGVIGLNLSYVILENSTLVASSVSEYSLNHSVVSGSNLSAGVVSSSLLLDVSLHASVVLNCTGLDLRVWDTTIVSSPDVQVVLNDGTGPATLTLQLLGAYPLLLSALPAVLPASVASYALVGEKLNRSLEPLLASPLSDRELLWGKVLGIFLPTLGVTGLGFGILAVVSDALTYGPLGMLLFPDASWTLCLLALAPLLAFMAITVSVIVSSRLTDVRSAQEVASLLVLPVLGLFIGAILTTAFTNLLVLGVLCIGLLALDLVLFQMAVDLFQREQILVHWK